MPGSAFGQQPRLYAAVTLHALESSSGIVSGIRHLNPNWPLALMLDRSPVPGR
jgi:hypothetical protein